MSMNVRCRYDALMPLDELAPNPKNANRHPEEQIERLAKILEYSGIRHPIVVSKRSGKITKGHGRLLAAKLNGWSVFPVEYQDYDSDDQELADLHADNEIARWAELDMSFLNSQLPEFGPDFDIDMLGIESFKLDPAELPKEEKKCPHCGGEL